jgi:phosphoenolpyruvate---glycerone phosphotransferase subunit DhaM
VTVGIVLVSHSAKIAEGLADVAGQMAPDVRLSAAGGRDGGASGDGIGTSFERVQAALAEAQDGDGVVVLCDLGSAVLTAETALDFLDDEERDRVLLVDAPLVEGAVAAAVAAQIGGDLEAVAAAARGATGASAEQPAPPPAAAPGDGEASHGAASEETGETAEGTAILVNSDGLHARPAAEFVRAASGFEAAVTINGVDAASLLGVLGLGLTGGSEAVIRATGTDARAAVDTLLTLLGGGFGERRGPDVGSL